MKKKFDKKRVQEQLRIVYMLQAECDSYEEWLEEEFSEIEEGKKYKGSSYNLFKDGLEDVFQRREEITLEELKKYISYYGTYASRKKIIVRLLTLYQDIYQNEEDYDKKLVDDTIKYFNFSKNALLFGRLKMPHDKVAKELENDIPIKNKTN